MVEWAGEGGEGYIRVIELETGIAIPITSAQDGLWDVYSEWSPANPRWLAVTQTDEPPEYGPGDADRLTIFDVMTGRTAASYAGDFQDGFDWSPDGSRILYPLLFGDTPCGLNLQTEETQCFDTIPTQIPNRGRRLVQLESRWQVY